MTRVCRKWNKVVACPRFMPYKKLYYAYKKASGKEFDEAQKQIEKIMREKENFMDAPASCFVGFIKK